MEKLVERDEAVLTMLWVHRFLTTIQLQWLVFTEHASEHSAARTARRVLSRLEGWGLIRRLERRVGGVRGGSDARVWQLAPAGARIISPEGGSYRVSDPSMRFLSHCLAVGDVHVLLLQHGRIEPIERIDVQIEGEAWRRYTGRAGEARWLQPDLSARIVTAEYEDRWFIEVDLGTESLPALLRKCAQYDDYYEAGQEQLQHGSFPLVLWIFTDATRGGKLQAALQRTPRLHSALHRFATPETISAVLAGGAA